MLLCLQTPILRTISPTHGLSSKSSTTSGRLTRRSGPLSTHFNREHPLRSAYTMPWQIQRTHLDILVGNALSESPGLQTACFEIVMSCVLPLVLLGSHANHMTTELSHPPGLDKQAQACCLATEAQTLYQLQCRPCGCTTALGQCPRTWALRPFEEGNRLPGLFLCWKLLVLTSMFISVCT